MHLKHCNANDQHILLTASNVLTIKCYDCHSDLGAKRLARRFGLFLGRITLLLYQLNLQFWERVCKLEFKLFSETLRLVNSKGFRNQNFYTTNFPTFYYVNITDSPTDTKISWWCA